MLVDPVPYEADESVRDSDVCDLEGSSKVRKMKSLMLEEAMSSIPEPGAGRVMHLVKAFERLLSIPNEQEGEENAQGKKGRVMKWALPGLQQQQPPPMAEETEVSSSSFLSSPEFERDCEHSSVDSNGDRSVTRPAVHQNRSLNLYCFFYLRTIFIGVEEDSNYFLLNFPQILVD